MIDTNNIPTLESIKKQYKEITDILKDCHTVEDARNIEKQYRVYIEIGNLSDYDAEHIDWLSVESWGDLGYIYYFPRSGHVDFSVFDPNDIIIDNATIDNIDIKYDDYVRGSIV